MSVTHSRGALWQYIVLCGSTGAVPETEKEVSLGTHGPDSGSMMVRTMANPVAKLSRGNALTRVLALLVQKPRACVPRTQYDWQ